MLNGLRKLVELIQMMNVKRRILEKKLLVLKNKFKRFTGKRGFFKNIYLILFGFVHIVFWVSFKFWSLVNCFFRIFLDFFVGFE